LAKLLFPANKGILSPGVKPKMFGDAEDHYLQCKPSVIRALKSYYFADTAGATI
jgi:hypothetical protein